MQRRRNASGSSFSLFEVMSTTGRSRAATSSPVSMTVKRISSSSRSRSFGNSRSALSTSSISSTWRVSAANASPERPELDVAPDVGRRRRRRSGCRSGAARCRRRRGRRRPCVVDLMCQESIGIPRPSATWRGEHGLAGAGLALDQQRPLERDGAVDGVDERARGDVAGGAGEALEVPFSLIRDRLRSSPDRSDGTWERYRPGPTRARSGVRRAQRRRCAGHRPRGLRVVGRLARSMRRGPAWKPRRARRTPRRPAAPPRIRTGPASSAKPRPGSGARVVDHARCEGKHDCVVVCPYDVFEVRRIDDADYQALSWLARLKVLAHRNQTRTRRAPTPCHGCGLCVVACPEKAITLARA